MKRQGARDRQEGGKRIDRKGEGQASPAVAACGPAGRPDAPRPLLSVRV
jgi:hypothetical protein